MGLEYHQKRNSLLALQLVNDWLKAKDLNQLGNFKNIPKMPAIQYRSPTDDLN